MESYKFYTLYLVEECPYCNRALDLAKDSGIEYYAQFMDWEDPLLSEAKQKYEHQTVPVIVETTVSEEQNIERLIGGFTELETYMKKEGQNA